jgi:hypothetical protein
MAILRALPDNAVSFDLDAARVARAEARAAAGQGSQFIKVSAGYIEVKAEVPLEAAYLLQQENIKEGLGLVLTDPADVDVLWSTLSADDFKEIIEFISGKTVGESQA